ncbi:MAG: hypothetical protein JRN52_09830 [Nitrososphaerota archaeon]|nr:hypothetical protein [Nitrososphaerota archaeon]
MHSTDTDARKYSKLASIPKYRLNIHEERLNEEKQTKTIQINFEQTLALKSLLKEVCDSSTPSSYLAAGDEDLKSLEEIELLTPKRTTSPTNELLSPRPILREIL